MTGNLCAVCGEHYGRGRLRIFSGVESADGELLEREIVAVVHPECWMRLSPEERDDLIDEATRAAGRAPDT
jgi:hypothetical protein